MVPSCPQLVPNWYQVGTQLQNVFQVGSKVANCYQVGTKLVPIWYQLGTALVPTWYLHFGKKLAPGKISDLPGYPNDLDILGNLFVGLGIARFRDFVGRSC